MNPEIQLCEYRFHTDVGVLGCDMPKYHDGVHIAVWIGIYAAHRGSAHDSFDAVPEQLEALREEAESALLEAVWEAA